MATALVGIIMGSTSDWETMQHAAAQLEALGVPFEKRVVSAHRTPKLMVSYAESAEQRGLKVVRLDERELDWSTAIVRALGCFLSFVVVGLGFIWVAFDDEKQSWHDKIAGTTIVRVPKGVSLI